MGTISVTTEEEIKRQYLFNQTFFVNYNYSELDSQNKIISHMTNISLTLMLNLEFSKWDIFSGDFREIPKPQWQVISQILLLHYSKTTRQHTKSKIIHLVSAKSKRWSCRSFWKDHLLSTDTQQPQQIFCPVSHRRTRSELGRLCV